MAILKAKKHPTPTEALSPAAIPKKLLVVGAGYIGLELGIAYRKLGAEVTVVEMLPQVLPAFDAELARRWRRRCAASKWQCCCARPCSA